MTEFINTCSGAISLAKKLEKDSSEFYASAAEWVSENKELFLSFAEENKKFALQIERAYYGVITDAIEGCFAFNLNPDAYEIGVEISVGMSRSEVVKKAIEVEEKMGDWDTCSGRSRYKCNKNEKQA